jgi:hypothetical protein
MQFAPSLSQRLGYHSLRWKQWLEATALTPSTRFQLGLTLTPHMGRPAVAAGASLRGFCAMAASVNSNRAPRGPRNRKQPSRRMRLRCANSISMRFRSWRDRSNASVLASAYMRLRHVTTPTLPPPPRRKFSLGGGNFWREQRPREARRGACGLGRGYRWRIRISIRGRSPIRGRSSSRSRWRVGPP